MVVHRSISGKIAHLVNQEISGLSRNGDRDGCWADVTEKSAVVEDVGVRSRIQKD